jgi:uncharacterized protein (TIGR02646 family)
MIYIDRTGFEPDVDWVNNADSLTQQLINAPDEISRNNIIDGNEAVWGELKDFLLSISFNKCWYSEAKDAYNHLHVDHFRPKKIALGIDKVNYGGYWWLAFAWRNYRVCGGAGNVRKRDKFAVRNNKSNDPNTPIEDELFYFLDPCEEEDVLKITFNQNGEVTPITTTGWDYARANYTIESLNLNFKLLKEARKEIWVRSSTLVSEIQNLMEQNDLVPSVLRRGQIKEKIKQLKELVQPSAEFSATVKACLLSTGLVWASKIAA